MGDYNINLANKHNPSTSEFLNILAPHVLLPAFIKPTRKNLTSATAIDNIFTDYPLKNCTAKILIDDTSDHFPTFLSTDSLHQTATQPVCMKRRTKNLNLGKCCLHGISLTLQMLAIQEGFRMPTHYSWTGA